MSTPAEEGRAMTAAWELLVALRRGDYAHGPVGASEARKKAAEVIRHFPMGGDLEHAAKRYAPELLGQTSREADELAQECAREAARAERAEAQLDPAPGIPAYLNVP